MKVTSQAPCRVDLAGGTLDIWPLYLYHDNAVTVNFAVDRHTRCSLQTRSDSRIEIRSVDQRSAAFYESLDALLDARSHKLALAAHIIRHFRPPTGLDMEIGSEAPAGAGISGSSSLMVSCCGAFNKLLGLGHSIEKVREIAQNIEAQIIRVPTGCQDYYPAMYGGVSAIEMGPAGIRRVAIPVSADELNARVVLAYTGVPRNSGINNWEVTKAHINGDKTVHKNFARIAEIANGMRAALEKSDWKEAAKLLRDEWSHRRKNAPGITTPVIDHLIETTRKAGARAAKVCGAGGGGCVLFLVEPDAKSKVSELIRASGVEVLDVKVAAAGLKIRAVQ